MISKSATTLYWVEMCFGEIIWFPGDAGRYQEMVKLTDNEMTRGLRGLSIGY
jgi:hypothetical protein